MRNKNSETSREAINMERQIQQTIKEKTENKPPIKTNWRYIAIVALVAIVLVVGGILLLKEVQTPPPASPSLGGPAPSPQSQILDTSGWQTYRNDEFGFEVRYPNSLIVREQSGGKDDLYLIQFFFEDPLKPANFFNGISIKVKRAGRFEIELESEKSIIVGHVADSITRETKIKGDLYQGVKLEYEVSTSGEKIPFTTTLINNGEYSYRITSTSDLIDQILSTFRFTE